MPQTVSSRRGVTRAQHSFAQIPSVQGQRSVFNRSHGLKTAYDAGLLIPIFVDEALPGDTMTMKMSSFARMATPLFPVIDNMYMDFFFFAVPNRLVWANWQKFNGEQDDPGDSIAFVIPTRSVAPVEESIEDYFGLPVGAGGITYSTLWHRAYNLIWNEWFRDENLQDSAVVNTNDGPDGGAIYPLRRRGKRHDYFTSCLPFVQKGTAVPLPLGTSAPLTPTSAPVALGTLGTPTWDIGSMTNRNLEDRGSTVEADWSGAVSGAGGVAAVWNDPALGSITADLTSVTADLSSATAATINQIREAFQIQRLLERDARGGSRYTEIIRAHFGVTSPDQRLQRPEYLGGGSTRININAVATTRNDATEGDNTGDLSAYGTAAVNGIGFRKSFVEHCLLIGLVSVRADLTYQQGMHRMWSRSTRYDFFWPAFAHLGEQAVLNQEIFADNSANDILTFGFQERWAEYRYKPSQITGKMRSVSPTSLDNWHLGLDFSALPVLNATFIEDNPPIDRVLAVPAEPHFLADFFFEYKNARPMPTYSVPGMVDHF